MAVKHHAYSARLGSCPTPDPKKPSESVLQKNHPEVPDFKNTIKKPYLEGNGDVVSRLLVGITRVTIRVTGVIKLLTTCP